MPGSALQAAAYEGPKRNILIDVGTADSFLENQLKPDDFSEAAAGNKALEVQLRKQARPEETPLLMCSGSACTLRLALTGWMMSRTVRALAGTGMHG